MHAQDRFFEMDLRRHITAGRLSELVGEGGLETDRVIRTLGWRRVAEAELPTLKPETRRYLQAYADGVNAYIKQQGDPAKMSLEYVVLGQKVTDYRVEDWTPADSLAWLKAMAWDLRGDYSAELMRARLAGSMPINQINELFPAYDYGTNKPILSGQDWSPLTSSANSAIPAERRGRRRRQARHGADRGQGHPDQVQGRPRRRDRSGRRAGVCRGAACAGRRPRDDGSGRRHRLQLVGRERQPHQHRQAAAGQRPAPRRLDPGHLVPGRPALPVGRQQLPVRRRRVLVLRTSRRRHRAQPVDRLGLHQPRSGRQRLLPRAGPGQHLPARRQAGAADDAHRDDQDRRRGRADHHGPQHRARPDPVRCHRERRQRRRAATGQRPPERRVLRGGAAVDRHRGEPDR